MAEGRETTFGDRPPADRVAWPFRSAPDPDQSGPTTVCPFLALEAADGSFLPAVGAPDPAHRCVAVGEPVPQSGGQQELVCLVASHASCPRYLRGVLRSATPPSPPVRQPVSRAVIGALLVLAAALAASFGFLAVRGGFDVPLASPTSALTADVTTTARPTTVATDAPTASPASTPSPSPSPSPSPAPTPSPPATPAPSATPVPTPIPVQTQPPTSDRFALLTKCPSTPDCWIYVIRAGDNLTSIANWFGVSYDRMIAMNPNLRRPIHAGDQLRMPTPTR